VNHLKCAKGGKKCVGGGGRGEKKKRRGGKVEIGVFKTPEGEEIINSTPQLCKRGGGVKRGVHCWENGVRNVQGRGSWSPRWGSTIKWVNGAKQAKLKTKISQKSPINAKTNKKNGLKRQKIPVENPLKKP